MKDLASPDIGVRSEAAPPARRPRDPRHLFRRSSSSPSARDCNHTYAMGSRRSPVPEPCAVPAIDVALYDSTRCVGSAARRAQKELLRRNRQAISVIHPPATAQALACSSREDLRNPPVYSGPGPDPQPVTASRNPTFVGIGSGLVTAGAGGLLVGLFWEQDRGPTEMAGPHPRRPLRPRRRHSFPP
ncbi:MAG: hypothetical protein R3F14_36555 [Polyangiaceae bacterium]